MAVFMDLKGTSQQTFQIQKGGPKIKNVSGAFHFRNAADGAYADLYAAILNAASDSMVINSDAAETGADWKMTVARPSSGMTANVTFTLPASAGTNGYVLQTDGSGTLSWVAQSAPPSVTSKITVDTTTLNFGATSPIAMFTLPANAVVHKVQVIIDSAFDGTPSLEIGISGTTDKYMAQSAVDLASGAGDRWESSPNQQAVGTTEAIIATYVSGSATQGSARLLVEYSIPE